MSTTTMKLQGEPLMPLAQQLLAEFEEQVPVTRKFLERLPEDKLTWKPHERSMSAGQLALHIAGVPGGVIRGVQQNPAQAPDFNNIPQPSSLREVLDTFEQSVDTVRTLLPQFDDASMQEIWRLLAGDKELFATPRAQFLRDIMLNHWYQHRGQFSVYLRLLNVPVPASWGPSADEQPNFARNGQSA
ncbi:MAG: DinB family protein [Edaphobacter sp.]